MSRKSQKPPERPNYPHTRYVASLYEIMAERPLSEMEARTVLNARVFESIIEVWLPELREMIAGMKEGPEFENTQLLIAQSAGMAQALAATLVMAVEEAQIIRTASDKEVQRILKAIK